MNYNIVAYGGPGGQFIYINNNGYLISFQTTSSKSTIDNSFIGIPQVMDMEDARKITGLK